MARIYDLSSRLVRQRPEVKFDDEHTFKVNNTKNGVLLMRAKVKEAEEVEKKEREEGIPESEILKNKFDRFDSVIGLMLGQKAVDYINEVNSNDETAFGVNLYKEVFNMISAAVSDISLEEAEEESKKREDEFRS